MAMRNCRWCVAIAATLLLAGCGGGAESDSWNGKAVALTKEQVRETLPDGVAMQRWKESARPTTVEMDKLYRSEACPIKGTRDARTPASSAPRRSGPTTTPPPSPF
jgi:hypothetical protein